MTNMRKPSSRHGMKQVIAFLQPQQFEAAVAKSLRDHQTNQEVIADAVNAVLAKYGLTPALHGERHRIVRRNRQRASVRRKAGVPKCRAGRQAFAAWFNTAEVEKVQIFCSEIGTPMQNLVEEGVSLITGVVAVADDEEDDAWKKALPDAA